MLIFENTCAFFFTIDQFLSLVSLTCFFYSFDTLNSLLRLWLINQKGIYVPMAFQHCVLFLLASDLQIRKQIKGERGKGSLYMPFIVHHYLKYERPGKKNYATQYVQ